MCIYVCDSHRTTVVKVELAVSMTPGGGSAREGRWEQSSEWERLSVRTSRGELRTGDTDIKTNTIITYHMPMCYIFDIILFRTAL